MENFTGLGVLPLADSLRFYLYQLAAAGGWPRAEADALLNEFPLTEDRLERFTPGQQRFILDCYQAIARQQLL